MFKLNPRPKPVGIQTCQMCHKKFDADTANTPNYKFCSKACWNKDRRISGVDLIEKDCAICGQTFEMDKYKNKDRDTCSRSCGNYKAWEDGKGKLEKMKVKPRACAYCEKNFINPEAKVKYCSQECINEVRRQKNLEKKLPDTPCALCGKLKRADRKYCSLKCHSIERNKRLRKLARDTKTTHIWRKLNKIGNKK